MRCTYLHPCSMQFSSLIHATGCRWKRHRRAAQTVLNPRAVEQYHGIQERQSEGLVKEILRDPKNWHGHIKEYVWRSNTSAFLLTVTTSSLYTSFFSIGYGETSLNSDATSPSYLENFMTRIVHAAIPGSSLTDIFPALASLPTWLSPSNRRYKNQFRQDDSKFKSLLSELKHDTVRLLTLHPNRYLLLI